MQREPIICEFCSEELVWSCDDDMMYVHHYAWCQDIELDFEDFADELKGFSNLSFNKDKEPRRTDSHDAFWSTVT